MYTIYGMTFRAPLCIMSELIILNISVRYCRMEPSLFARRSLSEICKPHLQDH